MKFFIFLGLSSFIHFSQASAEVLNIGPSGSALSQTYFGAEVSGIKSLVHSSLRSPKDLVAVSQDPRWKAYLAQAARLSDFRLETLDSKNKKIAFWVNVYNAMVLHGIVHFRPKKSVQDVEDFFDVVTYKIGSKTWSLNEIEHGVLRANRRPPYRFFKLLSGPKAQYALDSKDFDPRIHFVLNCGAASCPPFSFLKPDSLDSDLELAKEGFMSLELEKKGDDIFTSKILDWYSGDFEPSLREYLKKQAPPELRPFITDKVKIRFRDYNWDLVK